MPTWRYEWKDHEDFGEGWVPTFIANADPVTRGATVAHDCLEHLPGNTGFEGELMALGSVHFVRDCASTDSPMYGNTHYDGNKSDISYFLRNVHHGDETLRDPGPVDLEASDYIDAEQLRKAVRGGIALFIREHVNGEISSGRSLRAVVRRELPPNPVERMMGWMVKGAVANERRFERFGKHVWDVGAMFDEIAMGADKILKFDGCLGERLDVKVNFRTAEVSFVRRGY